VKNYRPAVYVLAFRGENREKRMGDRLMENMRKIFELSLARLKLLQTPGLF
jgi:hypothetical protein